MQNNEVKLVWTTEKGQELISYMARVSAPKNQENLDTAPRLIRYLIKHKHWSPFEMVNMCVSIKTSRAVARQILRHRSFHFQEFSQRYADPTQEANFELGVTEARLQDNKNRQNSIESDDERLNTNWEVTQQQILKSSMDAYSTAIENGIAKEVARVLLPEGLMHTHLYMNGTLRDWLHFCNLRCGHGTQKETIAVANNIKQLIKENYSDVYEAFFEFDV